MSPRYPQILCALLLLMGAQSFGGANAAELPWVPLVYDLTPYEQSVPEFAEAWRLLSSGETADGATHGPAVAALDSLWATEDEPLGSGWLDPLVRSTARWLRIRLLLRDGIDAWDVDDDVIFGDGSTLGNAVRGERAEILVTAGKGEEAAQLLLDTPPGSAGHLAASQRGVELLRALGLAAKGALTLETALARPLSSRARQVLTKLAATLHQESGHGDKAAALLQGLWWRSPSAQVRSGLEAALLEAGAPMASRDLFARQVLAARSRETKTLLKTIREKRKARKISRPLSEWATAVLHRLDASRREEAALRMERWLPKLLSGGGGPWAHVGHALVLRRLDRDQEAAAAYQQVAARWPSHPLANPALYEAAGLLFGVDLPADAQALYRRVAAQGPRGPTQRNALWEVGFSAVSRGQTGEAIQALTRLVARYGGERDGLGITWAERGSYWLARAKTEAGRYQEARRAYGDLVLRFPLGWYAMLAAKRLEHLRHHPGSLLAFAGASLASLDPVPTSEPLSLARLRVVRRPVLDLPVTLVRLGAEDMAIRELEALVAADLLPGSGRALLATLYRRAQRPRDAMRVLKRGAVLAEVPGPEDLDTYRGSYRFEHAELIETLAREHDLPPALLAGLVHVESRYDAKAVSSAGAIGLTQLMPRTARIVARKALGRRVSRRALRDPETNLLLGATLLRGLMDHFRGHVPLALAGYNAGRGAVRSWLRRRGHLETDAFVETIPYRQTRRYVMRVVTVADVYRRLHGVGGPETEVPLALPLVLAPWTEDAAPANP